jgi:uncharacterized protein YjbI with pentapeptide repeats
MEAIMRMEAIDRQLDRARHGEPEALSSLYRTLSCYKGEAIMRSRRRWWWQKIPPSLLAGSDVLVVAMLLIWAAYRFHKDNQREAALQAYIDHMSKLLLAQNLRHSLENEEVRKIARGRTLTVLRRLDAERKGSVLQFLHESTLLGKEGRIIDLTGADLSRAHLSRADLSGANLSHANLSRANLSGADLSEAILSEAILSGTNLSRTILSGTNLSEAYLMRANLRGADLIGANLNEADLSGAFLIGAILSRANLSGANLSGALVTPEQVTPTTSLQGTIMPDGSKHP